MTFRGWTQDALDFYVGLEAENSKTYFHAHKKQYEECVKAPFLALSDEIEREFGARLPERPPAHRASAPEGHARGQELRRAPMAAHRRLPRPHREGVARRRAREQLVRQARRPQHPRPTRTRLIAMASRTCVRYPR